MQLYYLKQLLGGRLRVKSLIRLLFFSTALCLAACTTDEETPTDIPPRDTELYQAVSIETIQAVDGQILYVPAYPEIYYGDRTRTLNLAITLAIHNTDLDHPIIVTSARYHDHEGNFVMEYVPDPLELPSLAALTFAVPRDDNLGNVGASFIVEWVADVEVADPIVEAVMIGPENQQGLSFVSVGRVISELE